MTRLAFDRSGWLNAFWLLALLAAGLWLSADGHTRAAAALASPRMQNQDHLEVPLGAVTSGSSVVKDAAGTAVPVRTYRRIVSLSTIADQVLLRICEPSRVAAVTARTVADSLEPWRYDGYTTVDRPDDLEQLLRLETDLLFVSHFADANKVRQLRERGVTVFNLGAMRGMSTLLPNIRQIAAVIGSPERGERLARNVLRQMQSIASDLPNRRRERALYVGAHGRRLYGGTSGSSYHDVMTAAGLVDVAAKRFRDWPAYDAEMLLALDPPRILTLRGQESALCQLPGLGKLRACRAPSGVVGVDVRLLRDPGLGMIAAAEAVHAAFYP